MRKTHIKQASCFLAGWLLFLILCQSGQGTEYRQVKKGNLAVVEYCDLVTSPDKFDGKEVTVRATYRYGFEWQELFCLDCRKIGKTWLEFDDDLVAKSKSELKKFPKGQGTVNAVFTGTFQSSKGPYGDGGYRFQLRVREISGAKVVSKSGWAPEHLPLNARKRVCGGQRPDTP